MEKVIRCPKCLAVKVRGVRNGKPFETDWYIHSMYAWLISQFKRIRLSFWQNCEDCK